MQTGVGRLEFRELGWSRWIWRGLKTFEWPVSTFCFLLWVFPFFYFWFQPSHLQLQFYQFRFRLLFFGVDCFGICKRFEFRYSTPTIIHPTKYPSLVGIFLFLLEKITHFYLCHSMFCSLWLSLEYLA